MKRWLLQKDALQKDTKNVWVGIVKPTTWTLNHSITVRDTKVKWQSCSCGMSSGKHFNNYDYHWPLLRKRMKLRRNGKPTILEGLRTYWKHWNPMLLTVWMCTTQSSVLRMNLKHMRWHTRPFQGWNGRSPEWSPPPTGWILALTWDDSGRQDTPMVDFKRSDDRPASLQSNHVQSPCPRPRPFNGAQSQ